MVEILILHVGWAREYRGATNDPPLGKFGYIQDGNDDAGEALNFQPYQGQLYGYSPVRNLNLQRLGAPPGATSVDNLLVIWTATEPTGSGRFIIGWYNKAKAHSSVIKRRPDKSRPDIVVEAKAKDCHLVPVDERTFWIPRMVRGWPGVSSAFYANQTLNEGQLRRTLEYVSGKRSTGFYSNFNSQNVTNRTGKGNKSSSTDAAKNALVELAAVQVVVKYYENQGWDWKSVEKENCGWDLEFMQGGRTLLVEVKGRESKGQVEVTPNEYSAMRDVSKQMSYRLAVVWHARSTAPHLTIFQYAPSSKKWISADGLVLGIHEKTAAVMTFEVP